MKKLNLKDKKLLKDSGIPEIWQWKNKCEDWESTTYVNFKTGRELAIRR